MEVTCSQTHALVSVWVLNHVPIAPRPVERRPNIHLRGHADSKVFTRLGFLTDCHRNVHTHCGVRAKRKFFNWSELKQNTVVFFVHSHVQRGAGLTITPLEGQLINVLNDQLWIDLQLKKHRGGIRFTVPPCPSFRERYIACKRDMGNRRVTWLNLLAVCLERD
ncbi:hypothetical protein HMPREF2698_04210 [Corynebacterium sp. HMSC072A02]|nr:hypothetical protein HMPREF2698_04210 [Corynebacterium sp. HMSC072A02]